MKAGRSTRFERSWRPARSLLKVCGLCDLLPDTISTMPTLSETITIPAAVDDVWPLLRDPALVASCIPGATLAPEQDGDTWKGSIRVKFGPTVATFRGEATLTYDDAAKRCTIAGRGIDQRGASRALANGVVSVNGSDVTRLTIDGEYSVTGPLETFANAGGVHVARALLAEFSANMAKVVAERQNTQASPPEATVSASVPVGAAPAPFVQDRQAAPPISAATGVSPAARISSPNTARPAAAELSVVKLVWSAFKSWLKSIFRSGSTKR